MLHDSERVQSRLIECNFASMISSSLSLSSIFALPHPLCSLPNARLGYDEFCHACFVIFPPVGSASQGWEIRILPRYRQDREHCPHTLIRAEVAPPMHWSGAQAPGEKNPTVSISMRASLVCPSRDLDPSLWRRRKWGKCHPSTHKNVSVKG